MYLKSIKQLLSEPSQKRAFNHVANYYNCNNVRISSDTKNFILSGGRSKVKKWHASPQPSLDFQLPTKETNSKALRNRTFSSSASKTLCRKPTSRTPFQAFRTVVKRLVETAPAAALEHQIKYMQGEDLTLALMCIQMVSNRPGLKHLAPNVAVVGNIIRKCGDRLPHRRVVTEAAALLAQTLAIRNPTKTDQATRCTEALLAVLLAGYAIYKMGASGRVRLAAGVSKLEQSHPFYLTWKNLGRTTKKLLINKLKEKHGSKWLSDPTLPKGERASVKMPRAQAMYIALTESGELPIKPKSTKAPVQKNKPKTTSKTVKKVRKRKTTPASTAARGFEVDFEPKLFALNTWHYVPYLTSKDISLSKVNEGPCTFYHTYAPFESCADGYAHHPGAIAFKPKEYNQNFEDCLVQQKNDLRYVQIVCELNSFFNRFSLLRIQNINIYEKFALRLKEVYDKYLQKISSDNDCCSYAPFRLNPEHTQLYCPFKRDAACRESYFRSFIALDSYHLANYAQETKCLNNLAITLSKQMYSNIVHCDTFGTTVTCSIVVQVFKDSTHVHLGAAKLFAELEMSLSLNLPFEKTLLRDFLEVKEYYDKLSENKTNLLKDRTNLLLCINDYWKTNYNNIRLIFSTKFKDLEPYMNGVYIHRCSENETEKEEKDMVMGHRFLLCNYKGRVFITNYDDIVPVRYLGKSFKDNQALIQFIHHHIKGVMDKKKSNGKPKIYRNNYTKNMAPLYGNVCVLVNWSQPTTEYYTPRLSPETENRFFEASLPKKFPPKSNYKLNQHKLNFKMYTSKHSFDDYDDRINWAYRALHYSAGKDWVAEQKKAMEAMLQEHAPPPPVPSPSKWKLRTKISTLNAIAITFPEYLPKFFDASKEQGYLAIGVTWTDIPLLFSLINDEVRELYTQNRLWGDEKRTNVNLLEPLNQIGYTGEKSMFKYFNSVELIGLDENRTIKLNDKDIPIIVNKETQMIDDLSFTDGMQVSFLDKGTKRTGTIIKYRNHGDPILQKLFVRYDIAETNQKNVEKGIECFQKVLPVKYDIGSIEQDIIDLTFE